MSSRPLRCTVVCPYGVVGGAERYLIDVLDATDRLRVDAVLLGDGPLRDALARRAVTAELLPTGRTGPAVARAAATLAVRLRRDPPEVVLANGIKAAAVAVPAARAAGVPVVWCSHDFSWQGPLTRWLGAAADGVVATSAAVAATTGRADAVVVPPPLPDRPPADRASARAEWVRRGVDPRARLVAGVVARLDPWKGADTAIRALTRPAARAWHLAIAGGVSPAAPDEAARLQRLARRLGVDDRVHLVGEVPDAGRWLSGLDAVAVLTRSSGPRVGREGYSLVALEALAAGVPLVGAADSPEVSRMARTAGVVVDAEDAGAVARAFAALADENRRRALGAAGRGLARAHPRPEQTADRLVAELAVAAGRPGAGLGAGPPVTVVVPVRDEEGHLDGVLTAVRAQLRTDDALVVVDDRSTDGTRAEVQAHAAADHRVRLVDGPGRGAGAARNAGLQQVRTAVVACTDAGCVPSAGWLEALRLPFAEPAGAPDAVIGTSTATGEGALASAVATACFPDLGALRRAGPLRRLHARLFGRGVSATRLDTRSVAVSVDAWHAVGGLDERVRGTEDALLGHALLRAGHRPVLAWDAEVAWEQPGSPAALARTWAHYAEWGARAGDLALVRRDLLRAAAYVLGPVALLHGGTRARAAVVLGAALYAGPSLAPAWRRGGTPAVVLVPVALALKDLAKAAGALRGLGRGLDREEPAS